MGAIIDLIGIFVYFKSKLEHPRCSRVDNLRINNKKSMFHPPCSQYIYVIFSLYAPEIEDRGHIGFVLSVILSIYHYLWNFNLANNFWTVSARALIFHMNIPCDKTFPWVPLFPTLWPWSLTHFLKTITLLITFEQQWVLELLYFTWVFFVIRPFRGYHYFYTVILTLEFYPFFF